MTADRSAYSQERVLVEARKRPVRPGRVPSMYLGQAHFFEEELAAWGQPGLWRAKTNNMPRIVVPVRGGDANLAQFSETFSFSQLKVFSFINLSLVEAAGVELFHTL